MTKSSLLLLAWCTIAANPLFSNKWLCDETWFRLTHARYPTLRYIGDTTAGVARGKFTAALNRCYATEASSGQLNPNGVYHAQFFHVCPYTDKNRRVNYFYFDSTLNNKPKPPGTWRDVADLYAKSTQMVERRLQVVRNRNNAEEANVEWNIRAMVNKKIKEDNDRRVQAKKDGSDDESDDESDSDDNSDDEEELTNSNHIGWLSSEAKALFLGSKDADGDVVEILEERMEVLRKVNEVSGYKLVLQSADDAGAELNSYQIWHIQQKAVYLSRAYQLALEKWGNQVNWKDICVEAIDSVNEFGHDSVTSPRTVMDYNIAFR